MADNNWLLGDSTPVSIAQEFEAAPVAAVWGWFGLPTAGEGSEFRAAEPAWTQSYWAPAELAFGGPEESSMGDVPNVALLACIDWGAVAITAAGLGGVMQT